jgi:hypothetical protein
MEFEPKFPPNFRDSIEDTGKLVSDLIDRAAAVAGNAGRRWIDGFEKADALAVADDIGAKLTEQVDDAWQMAQNNVIPPKN